MNRNAQFTLARIKAQQTLDLRVQENTAKKQVTHPRTRENREEFMRVYQQNVNGINCGGKEGVEEIMTHMQYLNISLFFQFCPYLF